jgi:hypothetical protein
MMRALLRLIEWLFALSLLAILVGGFRNLLGDNYDLMQRAEALTCNDEPDGCAIEEMRHERSFYAQTYDFRTHRRRNVHVSCLRDMILIGEYACTVSVPYVLNALPSAAPSGPRPSASSAPSGIGRQPPSSAMRR